jgi:hypothetical protein
MLATGVLASTDFYWIRGMATWMPLEKHFGAPARPAAIRAREDASSTWTVVARVTATAAFIVIFFGGLNLLSSPAGAPVLSDLPAAVDEPAEDGATQPDPFVNGGDDNPSTRDEAWPDDPSEPDEAIDFEDPSLA